MTEALATQEQNNDSHPAVKRARHLGSHVGKKRELSRANFDRALSAADISHQADVPAFTLAEASSSSPSFSLPPELHAHVKGLGNVIISDSPKMEAKLDRMPVAHVADASGPTHSASPQGQDELARA